MNQPTLIHEIDIVIADDHQIFRKGFASIFQDHTNIRVTAQAANGQELLEIVAIKKPKVVITDINMPVMDGIRATRIIREKFPDTEVIALSMHNDDNTIFEMLDAGAKGYLLKEAGADEVIHTIKAVYRKDMAYCHQATRKLLRLMARTNYHPYRSVERPVFTEKEIDIIQLICQELSSKEIAALQDISLRAVESARERIQQKIGAKNMVGVAKYAIQHGIFSIDN